MKIVIYFEKKRTKKSGLYKDKNCHISGAKQSSFDWQIQDLNVLHCPYRCDVVCNSTTNIQQIIIVTRIQISVLNRIKHLQQ